MDSGDVAYGQSPVAAADGTHETPGLDSVRRRSAQIGRAGGTTELGVEHMPA